jgi:alpha-methylacyl-CoA racemase
LLQGLGLDGDVDFGEAAVADETRWPAQRERLAAVFAGRTRDDWAARFHGTDACLAPVLDWDEAAGHPHVAARGVFTRVAGIEQARAAPRFGRHPLRDPTPPQPAAGDGPTVQALIDTWLQR